MSSLRLGEKNIEHWGKPASSLLGQALGDLKLPSRIIMAPMTRARAWNSDGAANEPIATYYAQRADAGLIITESSQIPEVGRGYGGTPGVHTAVHAAGWRIAACDGTFSVSRFKTTVTALVLREEFMTTV